MKINKKELSKELLKSFHTQFAENQREREKSFLQVLIYLAGPIAGNAYVYHNYLTGKNSTPPIVVTDVELFAIEAVSAFLLFVGTWMIATLSHNYRRDQYVNTRIRRFCGLIGNESKKNRIFPKRFDPVESLKDNGVFTWMPNFYLVFYGAFVGIQLLLLAMFYSTINPYIVLEIQHMDLRLTLTMFFAITLFFLNLLLAAYYRGKVISQIEVEHKEDYGLLATYCRKGSPIIRFYCRFRRKRCSICSMSI